MEILERTSLDVLCDIETDSLEATKIHVIVCSDLKTGIEYVFTEGYPWEKFEAFSKNVRMWVGHNFLGFDAYWLAKLTPVKIPVGKITDTLIMSRLLEPQMLGGHSLDEWGKRLGFPKQEFSDFSKLSDDMIKYCVNDVRLNVKLYKYLRDKLKDFSLQSLRLEHDVQFILDVSRRRGFFLDVGKAKQLLDECTREAQAIELKIHELFPPKLKLTYDMYQPRFNEDGRMSKQSLNKIERHHSSVRNEDGTYSLYDMEEFNLGSTKQIIERLNEAGWKPYVTTKAGAPKVCEENFATLPPESSGAMKLSEWLTLISRTRVIGNWLDYYNEQTRRVHGTIIGLGASTHRMAHRYPQMGNIPAVRSLKGEAMRSCWTVEDKENYCMVGTDISGIQLRLLAHLMDNPDYINAVCFGKEADGTDVHSVNRDVLRMVKPQVDRNVAKTFIYAMLLGAGSAKLGQIIGGTSADGKRAKEMLFERIKGFKKVERYCLDAASRGYIMCIDGRRITVPSAHYCLAIYLQANESIVMKKALTLMRLRGKHIDWHQLTVVHDEIQSEVRRDQAEELGKLQVQAITDAGLHFKLRCPLTGGYKVGDNWAKTH